MRKFRFCALLIPVLCFIGCHSTDMVVPSPDNSYHGHYTYGFEVSSFMPCGSSERWWVSAETRGLRTQLGERAGTVYAEVRGEISKRGSYGHLGAYSRELTVLEVVTTRLPGDKDCQ